MTINFFISDTMKKFWYKTMAAVTVALGAPFALLAEETSGSGADTATTVIENAQNSLEGILTTAGGAVAALVAAGLAIWGAIAIVGVLKRAFSAGKGR